MTSRCGRFVEMVLLPVICVSASVASTITVTGCRRSKAVCQRRRHVEVAGCVTECEVSSVKLWEEIELQGARRCGVQARERESIGGGKTVEAKGGDSCGDFVHFEHVNGFVCSCRRREVTMDKFFGDVL